MPKSLFKYLNILASVFMSARAEAGIKMVAKAKVILKAGSKNISNRY